MVAAVRQVVTPSAARLTSSLRDVGYDFPSAVADIVDNALAAGASRVDITVEFAGRGTFVQIADDGCGMSVNGLIEALRFGSRSTYRSDSLGRFGLGLKTASLSQARTLTVATRQKGRGRFSARRLDLDLIAEWDDWLIVDPGRRDPALRGVLEALDNDFATVVRWDNLDRVLPEKRPDGGWARRRVDSLIEKTKEHLAIVFHRFIEADIGSAGVVLTLNGEKINGWHPLAPDEPATQFLPELNFEIAVGDYAGLVRLQRAVLPTRATFSSPDEFDRLAGPMRWNRQQGLYFYRAGRLVQWGGWSGLRAIDEHTKLARASLAFDPDLDELFRVNVAKMRVLLPANLRNLMQDPLNELCSVAGQSYRSTPPSRTSHPGASKDESTEQPSQSPRTAKQVGEESAAPRSATPHKRAHFEAGGTEDHGGVNCQAPEPISISLALRSAALQTGDYEALRRIGGVLADMAPHVHAALRLRDL